MFTCRRSGLPPVLPGSKYKLVSRHALEEHGDKLIEFGKGGRNLIVGNERAQCS